MSTTLESSWLNACNYGLKNAYAESLVRAEKQRRQRLQRVKALLGAPKHGTQAQRARVLIGEGAHNKAATSLHTETTKFSATEQMEWITALPPCNTRPTATVSKCVPMKWPERAEIDD